MGLAGCVVVALVVLYGCKQTTQTQEEEVKEKPFVLGLAEFANLTNSDFDPNGYLEEVILSSFPEELQTSFAQVDTGFDSQGQSQQIRQYAKSQGFSMMVWGWFYDTPSSDTTMPKAVLNIELVPENDDRQRLYEITQQRISMDATGDLDKLNLRFEISKPEELSALMALSGALVHMDRKNFESARQFIELADAYLGEPKGAGNTIKTSLRNAGFLVDYALQNTPVSQSPKDLAVAYEQLPVPPLYVPAEARAEEAVMPKNTSPTSSATTPTSTLPVEEPRVTERRWSQDEVASLPDLPPPDVPTTPNIPLIAPPFTRPAAAKPMLTWRDWLVEADTQFNSNEIDLCCESLVEVLEILKDSVETVTVQLAQYPVGSEEARGYSDFMDEVYQAIASDYVYYFSFLLTEDCPYVTLEDLDALNEIEEGVGLYYQNLYKSEADAMMKIFYKKRYDHVKSLQSYN